MTQRKLAPTVKAEDVVWYLAHEIKELAETDLACTVDGDDITIRATRWLGDDLWEAVMDYVDSMDGEWVKDGKNSHWQLKSDWVADRVNYEKFWAEHRPIMEWWIQMPRSVKEIMKLAYPELSKGEAEDKAKFLATTREWLNRDAS